MIDYLNRPRTMDEIVSQWIVYRKPQEPDFTERVMIGKHLEKMLREGRVIKEGDHYSMRAHQAIRPPGYGGPPA